MAIITPIDSNVFRRRRQELAGREPQQVADNRLTTAQGLSLIPSAINLAGQLTTPIVSGIAEYARKQREQEAIDKAKAAHEAQAAGAEDLLAGKAAMENALAERMAINQPAVQKPEALAPSVYGGQPGAMAKAVGAEQGAGGAFAELLGNRPIPEQGFAEQLKAAPVAAPAAAAYAPGSDQEFAQGLGQTLSDYDSKIHSIAEKRAAPAIQSLELPKPVPRIGGEVPTRFVDEPIVERRGREEAFARPRAGLEMPSDQINVSQFPQLASKPIASRTLQDVSTQPSVEPVGEIPLTMDQIRKNAMLAAVSENPADRQKVIQQLFTAGENAYAPQSWSEIFNPAAAKERVQAEIMGLLHPQRGAMSDLERDRLAQQIANYKSLVEKRGEDLAIERELRPVKLRLANLAEKLKSGQITEQDAESTIAKYKAEHIGEREKAELNKILEEAGLAKARTGLADVQAKLGVPAQAKANLARARYEPTHAAAHAKMAEAAMIRATKPDTQWSGWYRREMNKLKNDDAKLAGQQAEYEDRLKSAPTTEPNMADPAWQKWFNKNASWFTSNGVPSSIEGIRVIRSKLAGVKKEREVNEDSLRSLEQDATEFGVNLGTAPAAAPAAAPVKGRTGMFGGTEDE